MAAASVQVPLRRRHARYELTAPVEVTVLRSGIPQSLPGRIVDAGMGGLSVVLSADLYPNETIGVEFQLADAPATVQARARVRYQDRLRSGLEFSTVSADKLELVRLWTDQRYRVMTSAADTVKVINPPAPQFLQSAQAKSSGSRRSDSALRQGNARSGVGLKAKLLFLLAFAAVVAVGVWTYLRFGTAQHLPAVEPVAASEGLLPSGGLLRRVIVAADVMQSLITYRTMPAYPQVAQQQGVQGTVMLDTIVGKDGRVLEVRPTSGPPELTAAAVDAVKNWRFSPFTLNGDAVEVETTIEVEFRLKDR